jgi:hypothetical protein
MSDSMSTRANIIALLVILTLSAGTMLWLFWRFPLMTAIIALVVLTAVSVLAHLARSTDVEMLDIDMDSGKQRI